MTGFRLTHDVPVDDDEGHAPSADSDDSWQESYCICWFDSVRRVGGWHHLGLQRRRGQADYWTALVLEGRVIGEEQRLTAPLPSDPMSDLHLGPMHIRTKDPLRSYSLNMEYASSGCDITYDAYTAPVGYVADMAGADIGHGHYESFGRVEGTVRSGDRIIEASGHGFQDHSWGPRNNGALLSFRNYMACFGPDLFTNVFLASTPVGPQIYGYVFDGEWQAVSSVDGSVGVADDGYTPLTIDSRLWSAASGRGWHLTGASDGVSFNTHTDDFFIANAYCTYELGGRVGAGVTCVRNFGNVPPWHRERLGLDG